MSVPTDEEKDDILLACRYGDLEDLQQFVKNFGHDVLSTIKDDGGNTVLHMTCGNGHLDLLNYLFPIIPSSLLSAQNNAGSTPLHWAALNAHLDVVQALVKFEAGPGVDLIDIKNAAGHTPLGEAELAGWDEGAKWLVEMMNLDAAGDTKEGEEDADEPEGLDASAKDIQVEIEDADGQIARMTISGVQ
ncbi:hypothetical protein ONZ45_g13719 [Pleurotus djamor]|nr:hypothetical protein ONZ45_g13719 [Pleurotus djamor]